MTGLTLTPLRVALGVAQATGQRDFLPELAMRLELHQHGQPYREGR